MDERTDILARVCAALAHDARDRAGELVVSCYPFESLTATARRYGPNQATRVFVRDGFIDRYTGNRLVFPPVLRVISQELPVEFPYHPNWKMDATHPAYWELTATIDHVVPVTRGGADDESNWVTTSMTRNSAKGNWLLEDLGWTLHQPGDFDDWDGLLRWFIDYVGEHPDVLVDKAMRDWHGAALEALT